MKTLREFPALVKREAGYQPDRVQHGLDPTDWKPMKSIGQGVREIRIQQDKIDEFRLDTLVDLVHRLGLHVSINVAA